MPRIILHLIFAYTFFRIMKKKTSLSAITCFFIIVAQLHGQTLFKPQVDDNSKFTTTGNIGLTISNYGTFGDGFAQQSPVDQPSCEYPKESGVEHLFGGGLWVGAETSEGPKVTTGAFNSARFQTSGSYNFEFTNTADPNDRTTERSSLPGNRYFSPEAVSHQDFVVDFSDTNIVIPGTNIIIPNHIPMGIAVHLETYAWNFPFADAFIIFNYHIENVWDDTLENVYAGMWADLVVRNVNITPPRIGAPFYQHVGVGHVTNDSMQFIYAYDYDGDPGFTDSYVAMTYLGADPVVGDQIYNKNTTHNWWLFSGGIEEYEQAPTTEVQRLERMRVSFPEDIYKSLIFQSPGNWMNLISTGPFERIKPGESINVVFAIVCAKKYGFNPATRDDDFAKTNLYQNVSWAQKAYHGEDSNRNGILDPGEDVNGNGKLDRFVLPTPPVAPRLKTFAGNHKVTLMWDNSSEYSIDLISKQRDFEGYRVYRSFLGDDKSSAGMLGSLKLIHEYDLKNRLFFDTGMDAVRMDEPEIEYETDPETGKIDTITYTYRIEITNLQNGWPYAFAVSAFDSGDATIDLPSLESSNLQNAVIVTPGTPPATASQQPEIGVYPNPYRVNALWDGQYERDRKLHFYNLPANCEVRIYTLAGDLVDSFNHSGLLFSDASMNVNGVFSGGEHAWDIVSKFDQAIATGLYLFTVKDNQTGEVYTGKFVIIK